MAFNPILALLAGQSKRPRDQQATAAALLELAGHQGIAGGLPDGWKVNHSGNARDGRRYRTVGTDSGDAVHVYEDGTRVRVPGSDPQPSALAHAMGHQGVAGGSDAPAVLPDGADGASVSLEALLRPRRRRRDLPAIFGSSL